MVSGMSGVEQEFMPWLLDSAETQLNLSTISRHLLDAVIHDVVRTRCEQYSKLEPANVTTSQPVYTRQDEPTVETTATDNDEQQASSPVL